MRIVETTRTRTKPGAGRTRRRGLAVVLALALVAAACGGSDSVSPEEGSGPAGENESGAEGSETITTVSAQFAGVDLPSGLQLSTVDNQTATLNGVGYLVAETADGMRLAQVAEDGAAFTEALIPGGHAAEVFNSGSRIVMAGLDGAGNLLLLSSPDGDTFVEASIPVPARYVDADVWDATSLIGDAMGVADLDGDLYLVASLGIRWPRAVDVAARHGYTVSEEVGDAATSAGIVKQTPQGGGEFLYEFEVDGEVVFSTLGSEAGLEPGYRPAADAALDADTHMVRAWLVSGSTVTQFPDPPFDGGLEDDMRLMALYPVADGAAAIVADFSPEEEPSGDDEAAAGQPGRISHTASRVVPVQTGGLLEAVFLYVVGAVITNEPTRRGPIADTTGNLPETVEVVADVANNSYQLLMSTGGELSLLVSGDGKQWPTPPQTLPLTLPFGGTVELILAGDATLLVFPPEADDEAPRVVLIDGFVHDSNSLESLEIAAAPTFAWIDPEPVVVEELKFVAKKLFALMIGVDGHARGEGDSDNAVTVGTPLSISAILIAEILDPEDN